MANNAYQVKPVLFKRTQSNMLIKSNEYKTARAPKYGNVLEGVPKYT